MQSRCEINAKHLKHNTKLGQLQKYIINKNNRMIYEKMINPGVSQEMSSEDKVSDDRVKWEEGLMSQVRA